MKLTPPLRIGLAIFALAVRSSALFATGLPINPPTASDLCDKMIGASKWVSHCAMKVETHLQQIGYKNDWTSFNNLIEWRRDLDQVDLIALSSSKTLNGQVTWDSSKSISRGRFIVNKERRFEYSSRPDGSPNTVKSSRSPQSLRDAFQSVSSNEGYGAFLAGYCWYDHDRSIGELLHDGTDQTIRADVIDGEQCYAVSAKTPYGIVEAWIAPEKEFNCLKFVVKKGSDDIFDSAPLASRRVSDRKVVSCQAVCDQIKVTKVGERFVVESGRLTTEELLDNGVKATEVAISDRSNIDFDPDFAAIKAFVPADLPEGTPIAEAGLSGKTSLIFEWRGGQVVPRIDQQAVSQIQSTVKSFANMDPPIMAQPRDDRPVYVAEFLAGIFALAAVVGGLRFGLRRWTAAKAKG